MAQVAMYMPSWHQPWGAPLLFVICRARMRVPTKRIASMGQKAMVPLAFSMVLVMKCISKPVNSLTVIAIQMKMYTTKNCTVRLITHCIVTEIGGVYCGPWGCSMAKTDQITAETPRYREKMTM